ncbi:MAG: hypothetical protein HUJ26_04620 [Planctomycetaceae bacterium]|nr:hypothetical protein [Planctomycetaceae bacterium]
MAHRIFYGVAGEGLGHASRVLSLIGHLPDCEIHVFTFGKAYDFFKSLDYPHLHRIDGLMFAYCNGVVNYRKTLSNAVNYYFSGLTQNLDYIEQQAEELQPALFVTDFEPSVIRAAHLMGQPVLSIDNQHKFVDCRAPSLPASLQLYAMMTSPTVRTMVPSPTHSVVATFHADRLEAIHSDVTLTGGILRQEVESHPVTNEGFILTYLRHSVAEQILSALAGCGREVRVYGASPEQRLMYRGQFRFFDLSPDFVHDLASCDRVIAPAGNQLISECRYFQKPILAIPEPGQYEQAINAHFAEEIGLGTSCEVSELTTEILNTFISRFSCRSNRIPNGVHDVIRVIRTYLPNVFGVESYGDSGEDRIMKLGNHFLDDPPLKMA